MSILRARRYQPKDADLDALAASNLAAAWTAYTPTITAAAGTFTTVSATGRFLVIGKLTLVQMTITITTNGTAATAIQATLPSNAAAPYVMAGRDTAATKAVIGRVNAGVNNLVIRSYDGTYPGGTGNVLDLSGFYEAA